MFSGPRLQKNPMHTRAHLTVVVLVMISNTVRGDESNPRSPSTPQFNRDIRPVLSAACFQCHGPDKANRKKRLRLDEEKGVRRVFEPGSLEESKGWHRIISKDPDEVMPPPDSHRKLEPREIELVRRWIEQGAEWQGHWSFIAPRKPTLPAVENREWVRRPIDAFVLARLEQEGLSTSPDADRGRTLRRVTLDLTGLPPTIAEIDAFLTDERPDAYEHVVDRLLESPHYGERMTLAWMDAARYGDTSVFHADGPRDMWPWRDWVIRAYNSNTPFDEFTVQHIAGDLLPEPSVSQQVATGFLRNNATTDEGGVIPEEFRVEYAVDRVATTSTVWLALSMQCGQCHDHKYDPISQEEYYRFFAYFNQASDPGMQTRGGNQKPVVDVPNFDLLGQAETLKESLTEIGSKRTAHAAQVEPRFLEWLTESEKSADKKPPPPDGLLFHVPLDETKGKVALASPGGQATDGKPSPTTGEVKGKTRWEEGKIGGCFELDGGNWVEFPTLGDVERTDSFSFGAWVRVPKKGAGAPLARMDNTSGFRGWDLHLDDRRVQVHLINTWDSDALKVKSKGQLRPDTWQHVFVTYDGSSKASGVRIYVDGKPQEHKVERDHLRSTIRTDKPLKIGRRHTSDTFRGRVDDVRFYGRKLNDAEVGALGGTDPIGPLLTIARDKRSAQQTAQLRKHYLETRDDEYRKLDARLDAVRRKLDAARKPVGTVMVMKDVPKLRDTFVLERGNYASPNKSRKVRPNVPASLPALAKDAPENRLGLARWLVRPDHPLTARVAVNRYWYMLFGTGIVKTVEDFGSQGEWPSHPALLDWLAIDFVESGWNVKRMIRNIVTSSTYRQSSRITPELLERDPENRLLARGPRFRLEGEFIRDSALAASGLLVRDVGGRGVKPYQPPGLWNEVSLSGNVRFVPDKGEKLYRRSMYTYWKRSSPAPSLTIFDTPSREKCVMRRSRTNTPLQALVTLNDPQFVEAARVLASRVIREHAKLPERITLACRLLTGTRPHPAMLRILADTYNAELAVFRASPERAGKLLSIGEWKRDEAIDPAEHAAMTIVTSTILNLDSTLTRG